MHNKCQISMSHRQHESENFTCRHSNPFRTTMCDIVSTDNYYHNRAFVSVKFHSLTIDRKLFNYIRTYVAQKFIYKTNLL